MPLELLGRLAEQDQRDQVGLQGFREAKVILVQQGPEDHQASLERQEALVIPVMLGHQDLEEMLDSVEILEYVVKWAVRVSPDHQEMSDLLDRLVLLVNLGHPGSLDLRDLRDNQGHLALLDSQVHLVCWDSQDLWVLLVLWAHKAF